MPLSAYVNGEYVYGPDIPNVRWEALKRDRARTVALPCGRPGFLRVSPKGTKHFVHRANHDDCPWAHESADHVDAKLALVSALRESGWDVRTEQCAPDWRADVLATSPDATRRVAFEVQLSPQSYDETVVRQGRFMAAGVEGVWLFRTRPTLELDPLIPMFRLYRDLDGGWRVQLRSPQRHAPSMGWSEREPAGTLPLGDFARSWLAYEVKLCRMLYLDEEWTSRITIYRTLCPACGRENINYTVSAPQISSCGVLASEIDAPSRHEAKYIWHLAAHGSFGARTRAVLRRFLDSSRAPRTEGERTVIRVLTDTPDDTLRYVCRWCPYVFSVDEVTEARRATSPTAVLEWSISHPGTAAEVSHGERALLYPHWCLRHSEDNCDAISTQAGLDAPRWIYYDSEAKSAEKAALPIDRLVWEVIASFRREGWSYCGPVSIVDETCSVFERGNEKALAIVGTADWSRESMEQLFWSTRDQGFTLFWFTADRALADDPSFAGHLLIPVRAEMESVSRWRYFVVLGPGEEQDFAYAMHVLIPRCKIEREPYAYI